MRAFHAILVAAALSAAACAPALPVAELEGSALELPAECAAFTRQPVVLVAEPGVARQGGTLALRALTPGAGEASREAPLACFGRWTIAPADAASLSSDHGQLSIAPDAPAGELLTIGAQGPAGFVHLTTPVVARDEVVLTGRWRQVEIDCPSGGRPDEAVRELEFDDRGGFAVTYLPFETYRDYWGRAHFDSAEGRLTLSVEGGNRPPRDGLLDGRAYVDSAGRLVLDGFHLGGQGQLTAARPCRYVFTRA